MMRPKPEGLALSTGAAGPQSNAESSHSNQAVAPLSPLAPSRIGNVGYTKQHCPNYLIVGKKTHTTHTPAMHVRDLPRF